MLSSLINSEKDYLKREFAKDWANLIVKPYRKIHKNQIKELALLSKRLYYRETPVPKYEYDSYFNLGFYYKDRLFVYDDEMYLEMRQYYRISLPYLHKDLEKEGSQLNQDYEKLSFEEQKIIQWLTRNFINHNNSPQYLRNILPDSFINLLRENKTNEVFVRLDRTKLTKEEDKDIINLINYYLLFKLLGN